jgi:hypothetical protein
MAPTSKVTSRTPGVDDNYEMYFIFRYAHYVLDIEIVALFVRCVVTYGVQSIIAFTVMYSHVRSEVVA